MARISDTTIVDRLSDSVRHSIDMMRQEMMEEIIKKAVADYELRLRHELSNIAIDLSRYFSITTMGEQIIITIHSKVNNGIPQT